MKQRRNILLAMTTGVLLGLPWCIPSLFFLIFIAWVPLLILEENIHRQNNVYTLFNYAFLSFLVWNIMSTWWIIRAQLLGAIVVILLNTLLMTLVFWAISKIRTRRDSSILLPFIIIWIGYEHFHQYWDLAWPWLNLGNSLATAPKAIQWYQFTGVRGGSLWILLINIIIHKAIQTHKQHNLKTSLLNLKNTKNPKDRINICRNIWNLKEWIISLLLIILIPSLFSLYLLQTNTPATKFISVAIVQPNIDPYTEKFDPQREHQHLSQFYEQAQSVVDSSTIFLLGPETLIVDTIAENHPQSSPSYSRLLQFQRKYPNLSCIIGVHSYNRLHSTVPPGSRFNKEQNYYYEAFNSALFTTKNSRPQFAHKTKLVPLFERMPFIQYLHFLGKYSLELGGYNGTYSCRKGVSNFTLPDSSIRMVPIICFESIFRTPMSNDKSDIPEFICVLTNDGWWKQTPGYAHHFNFSILRAIETQRSVVRVANTGISALIDAKGTIIVASPWWKKWAKNISVPLRNKKTFYSIHHDFIGRLSLFLTLLLILITIGQNRAFKR